MGGLVGAAFGGARLRGGAGFLARGGPAVTTENYNKKVI